MDPQHITLLSFGNFEKNIPEMIGISVKREFGCAIEITEDFRELSPYYDPARKQYDGNELLKVVNQRKKNDALKIIGLFRVDLFIPILTFIFGQAQLNGHSAIASVFRMNNERYGMPPDEKLLQERFVKEVIHELGHTFGLKHCFNPGCVMNSSTYVEEIDLKKDEFCPVCRNEINRIIN